MFCLLALCVGAPKKSFRFALIRSAGSVLGGMFSYLIGYAAWHAVKGLFIPYVCSQTLFDKVQVLYQGNAFAAVKALLEKYFDWFAWGLLALGIGGFMAIKYLA